MRLRIHHVTHYRFDRGVQRGLQQIRKRPKSSHGQSVLNWRTDVTGGKRELSFDDHHNNRVELLSFERDTQEIVITSEGEVEVTEQSGVVGPHLGPAPLWLYKRSTPQNRAGAGVRAIVRRVEGDDDLTRLHDLSRLIAGDITYEIASSDPDWTAEDAVAAGKGVCQDHTHVFVAAARELGLPARYVSGYLMLNDRTNQEAMHAWAEAHVEGLGWVGFDVSNGISSDERYVRVATGLDYADAAPVKGIRMGGAGEGLSVRIEVAEQPQ